MKVTVAQSANQMCNKMQTIKKGEKSAPDFSPSSYFDVKIVHTLNAPLISFEVDIHLWKWDVESCFFEVLVNEFIQIIVNIPEL